MNVRNWLLRNRPFLVFGPLVVALTLWALSRTPLSAGRFTILAFAGLLAWTLLEWLAHRAMHLDTGIATITRLQDSAHLRHHREPDDLEHSVIKLRASLPLAVFFFGIARLLVGSNEQAAAVMCGLLTGYLLYEAVHLLAHGSYPLPGLKALQAMHLRHHFGPEGAAFGVTSPIWDLLFGTYRPRSKHAWAAPSKAGGSEPRP